MKIMVVPNILRDKINEALDCALADCPGAECERENLYSQLLSYFDEHGVIPDFSIVRPEGGQ